MDKKWKKIHLSFSFAALHSLAHKILKLPYSLSFISTKLINNFFALWYLMIKTIYIFSHFFIKFINGINYADWDLFTYISTSCISLAVIKSFCGKSDEKLNLIKKKNCKYLKSKKKLSWNSKFKVQWQLNEMEKIYPFLFIPKT